MHLTQLLRIKGVTIQVWTRAGKSFARLLSRRVEINVSVVGSKRDAMQQLLLVMCEVGQKTLDKK